ncbi:hypothetical protein Abr02nite_69860 [Paractinoplanes brasiliensis]|nr:hypothetical protein Abr02nite_69860 [Actinoplanes brasiliensis]
MTRRAPACRSASDRHGPPRSRRWQPFRSGGDGPTRSCRLSSIEIEVRQARAIAQFLNKAQFPDLARTPDGNRETRSGAADVIEPLCQQGQLCVPADEHDRPAGDVDFIYVDSIYITA